MQSFTRLAFCCAAMPALLVPAMRLCSASCASLTAGAKPQRRGRCGAAAAPDKGTTAQGRFKGKAFVVDTDEERVEDDEADAESLGDTDTDTCSEEEEAVGLESSAGEEEEDAGAKAVRKRAGRVAKGRGAKPQQQQQRKRGKGVSIGEEVSDEVDEAKGEEKGTHAAAQAGKEAGGPMAVAAVERIAGAAAVPISPQVLFTARNAWEFEQQLRQQQRQQQQQGTPLCQAERQGSGPQLLAAGGGSAAAIAAAVGTAGTPLAAPPLTATATVAALSLRVKEEAIAMAMGPVGPAAKDPVRPAAVLQAMPQKQGDGDGCEEDEEDEDEPLHVTLARRRASQLVGGTAGQAAVGIAATPPVQQQKWGAGVVADVEEGDGMEEEGTGRRTGRQSRRRAAAAAAATDLEDPEDGVPATAIKTSRSGRRVRPPSRMLGSQFVSLGSSEDEEGGGRKARGEKAVGEGDGEEGLRRSNRVAGRRGSRVAAAMFLGTSDEEEEGDVEQGEKEPEGKQPQQQQQEEEQEEGTRPKRRRAEGGVGDVGSAVLQDSGEEGAPGCKEGRALAPVDADDVAHNGGEEGEEEGGVSMGRCSLSSASGGSSAEEEEDEMEVEGSPALHGKSLRKGSQAAATGRKAAGREQEKEGRRRRKKERAERRRRKRERRERRRQDREGRAGAAEEEEDGTSGDGELAGAPRAVADATAASEPPAVAAAPPASPCHRAVEDDGEGEPCGSIAPTQPLPTLAEMLMPTQAIPHHAEAAAAAAAPVSNIRVPTAVASARGIGADFTFSSAATAPAAPVLAATQAVSADVGAEVGPSLLRKRSLPAMTSPGGPAPSNAHAGAQHLAERPEEQPSAGKHPRTELIHTAATAAAVAAVAADASPRPQQSQLLHGGQGANVAASPVADCDVERERQEELQRQQRQVAHAAEVERLRREQAEALARLRAEHAAKLKLVRRRAKMVDTICAGIL